MQSEYVADCDKRREFISSFSGSAGTAVVTLDQALLWTDGRYHLQASQELDQNWTLMRDGLPDVPKLEEWLAKVEHLSICAATVWFDVVVLRVMSVLIRLTQNVSQLCCSFLTSGVEGGICCGN